MKSVIPQGVRSFLRRRRWMTWYLTEPYCFVRGWFAYHHRPRKTIVQLMSSMRSGSTLVKALLAADSDVSHLPEVHYRNYSKLSRYSAYYRICRLSPASRIIVLKNPGTYTPLFDTAFLRLKLIVLTRNLHDTAQSVARQEMLKHGNGADQLARYWRNNQNRAIKLLQTTDHDTIVVRYEDVRADPIKATAELFAFIGSTRTEGVDSYPAPSHKWKWGNDDGGDNIRSMQVLPPKPRARTPLDEELDACVAKDPELQQFLARFGYDDASVSTR